jgi:hypothetical protein
MSADDAHVKSYWVQLALADEALLAGLFLLTSRFLNVVFQRTEYLQPAIRYKLACLGAISKALSAQAAPDNVALSIALILATDEVRIIVVHSCKVHYSLISWLAGYEPRHCHGSPTYSWSFEND